MKKLFVVLLTLTACGGDENDEPKNLVPSELYSRHVTEFYQELSSRGISSNPITPVVKFADLPNCNLSSSSGTTIQIDNSLSDYQNDQYFGSIIYRELAHLSLNKPYETAAFKEGCDYLVMYPCANIFEFENNTTKEETLDCLFNN